MRVGTRYNFNPILIDAEDHPHACGDKFGEYTAGLDKKGSSPCVWGQAPMTPSASCVSGIIPMRVGTRI